MALAVALYLSLPVYPAFAANDGNISNLTLSICLFAIADSNSFTFNSLLFFIASAIAVYKSISIFSSQVLLSFLIFSIFAISSFAFFSVSNALIGSSFLLQLVEKANKLIRNMITIFLTSIKNY